MNTIRTSLNQVKKQFKDYLTPAAIQQVCRDEDYVFRKRRLGPVETIFAFCIQVLHGNTACTAVRHWLGSEVTDSAYCQARQRLPLAIFKKVLKQIASNLNEQVSGDLWKGLRVYLIDGTTFSMPDTAELEKTYSKPSGQKEGCGFPVAELLVMVHWSTGMILDLCAMPWRQHEQSKVSELHPSLKKGDVLVADRGFCSYAHIAQLCLKGINSLFRIGPRIIVDFTPGRPHTLSKHHPKKGMPRSKWIRLLGTQDQIVSWKKPKQKPKHLSPEIWLTLPDELVVRELSYSIETPGYRTEKITLVTTLLDSKVFTKDDLSDLYMIRWRIEVNFRDLKTTMGLDILKCKTVDGISKELAIFAMLFNMVMSIRYRAGQLMGVCASRISFIDILRQVCLFGFIVPDTVIVNPYRPERWQPRVVKRRPKSYPLMTTPRNQCVIGDDAKA